MPTLPEIASQRSGVPLDEAFSIDQVQLTTRLPQAVFISLSTAFYDRVFADEEEWFREIFATSSKEAAIQNQYEFFIQRLGGPHLYSQRKGHPALIGRHGAFDVTPEAAERWLHHMSAALDATPEIDPDSRRRMWAFFRHTAYFLVGGQELMRERAAQQAAAAAAAAAGEGGAAAAGPPQL